jgi:hypothetical protein
MQVFESNTFGAEIPAAENVCGVPANLLNTAIRHGQLEAAAGFTEGADPMVYSFSLLFNRRWDHRWPPVECGLQQHAAFCHSPDWHVQGTGKSKVKILSAIVNSRSSCGFLA